ncbi:MAG: hypothetical protein E2O68_08805 [Deltaproteobacteria bacterium]|nr:MAG: hypothetical protein E2O68_08805 [Deltaproteobacteria bacterium]
MKLILFVLITLISFNSYPGFEEDLEYAQNEYENFMDERMNFKMQKRIYQKLNRKMRDFSEDHRQLVMEKYKYQIEKGKYHFQKSCINNPNREGCYEFFRGLEENSRYGSENRYRERPSDLKNYYLREYQKSKRQKVDTKFPGAYYPPRRLELPRPEIRKKVEAPRNYADEVSDIIYSHRDALNECYKNESKGYLKAKLDIMPNGALQGITWENDEFFKGYKTLDCLAGVLHQMEFKAPPSGKTVTVTQSFYLKRVN